MTGLTIGIIGLALCAILCGIGSGFGLKFTTSAATGVMSEDPSKFSKVILIALLPATQGIYGFVIAIMGISNLPAAGADPALLAQGWSVLFAALPMALGGMVSALLQGKAAATTILAIGKKEEISGKSLIFPAMIEFYALLGMVISIMLLGVVA